MANATYSTNMTYNWLTLCMIGQSSNVNYPGSGCKAIIPTECFLDVQTAVHPHRNKDRRQDQKERVDAEDLRATASR